jgi:hypothetical protein
MLALIPEIFRYRHGGIGALTAHQRRFVRSGGDNHRPLEAFFAQGVFNEFLQLAATFADQRDHVDIGGGIAGQHRHQHRLADARGGENANTLAPAQGDEGIERPHAQIYLARDPLPFAGRRGGCAQFGRKRADGQRALLVNRLAQRVNHPAQPSGGGVQGGGGDAGFSPAAQTNPVQRAKSHELGAIVFEAYDLAGNPAVAPGNHIDPPTNRKMVFQSADFNH